MNVCKNLKDYINLRQINKVKIAEILDVDPGLFEDQLNGSSDMSLGQLRDICKILGIKVKRVL